jgi:hypothetical protein
MHYSTHDHIRLCLMCDAQWPRGICLPISATMITTCWCFVYLQCYRQLRWIRCKGSHVKKRKYWVMRTPIPLRHSQVYLTTEYKENRKMMPDGCHIKIFITVFWQSLGQSLNYDSKSQHEVFLLGSSPFSLLWVANFTMFSSIMKSKMQIVPRSRHCKYQSTEP